MERMDNVRRFKDVTSAKLTDPELGSQVRKVAGDAVVKASETLNAVESIAQRSGMASKDGKVSKRRVLGAALRPRKRVRQVLDATADVIREGRNEDGPTANDQ